MQLRLTKAEIVEIFTRHGAILKDGHFVYNSGLHGSAYVNKNAVFPDTEDLWLLCNEFTHQFCRAPPDTVIGPVTGGVTLASVTAHFLTQMTGSKVLGIWADKKGDGFEIGRDFNKVIKDRRVLVVEDILTTGGSVRKVVNAVRDCGGIIVGVAALCNRGGVTKEDVGDLPVPELYSLMEAPLDAYDPEKCPLCAAHVPINTTYGHGRKFLTEHPEYLAVQG